MIDPNIIRENPELVKKVILSGRGNPDKADIDKWLQLDSERRALIIEKDNLNQERNKLAELGKNDPEKAREKGKEIKERITNLEALLMEVEKNWQEILDWIPNIPFDEVPVGLSEEDNEEIKAWVPDSGYLEENKLGKGSESSQYMPKVGSNADIEFTPKPHWEVGPRLGIIDLEAGANVSGSRFYYIKKEGVLLIQAFFNLLMRKLLQEGFEPMIVPLLV